MNFSPLASSDTIADLERGMIFSIWSTIYSRSRIGIVLSIAPTYNPKYLAIRTRWLDGGANTSMILARESGVYIHTDWVFENYYTDEQIAEINRIEMWGE